MKHAVVVSRLFAPEPAAAAFRLEALVRALAAAGTDVTVLTSNPRPGSPPADDAALAPAVPDGAGKGTEVSDGGQPATAHPGRVRVRRARVLRDSSGYVRGYLPYLSFDVPAAFRLLAVRRPDVVVVEPPPTTGVMVRIVCALRRVPYVYYAADVWSDAARSTGSPGIVSNLLAGLEGWAMRGARGIVAVSEGVATRVHALAGPKVDVEIVRNGIDTTTFHPTPSSPPTPPADFGTFSPVRQSHLPKSAETAEVSGEGGGAGGRYFLYAGTASEWQGAEVFVLALERVRERHPDVELVYLGSGSAWAGLLDLAQRSDPGAVHLLAPVPPAQAARWHRGAVGALVSIVPGLGYDFALPTKIFAASASGVPVIFAGPTGTASEVVEDGGLGAAVGHDPEAVAEAMVTLLEAPEATDPALREARATRLAAWTHEHASIARVGERVAALAARWSQKASPGEASA
ncbi:MAG: glycosyltransferase family 4 protein [Actinomycetales bacterium]|nr:glycosyltransferase family 4 protein [Actinomycetales bacterium]